MPAPILVSVGSLNIHWYGLLLALAIIMGYGLARVLAKRQNFALRTVESLYLSLVVWGFVGARLYHGLNEWPYYWHQPLAILLIWQGGLAIHGAILAGVAVLYYYSRKHQLNFWSLADLFSVPLILGQAIGRWGNYFNQELFGRPTNLPWGIPIAGREGYYHPTFLYESLWDLAVFFILLGLYKKNRPAGLVFWFYIVLYSAGRLGVELLRIDPVPLLFGVRLPFLVSAAGLLLATVMIIRKRS